MALSEGIGTGPVQRSRIWLFLGGRGGGFFCQSGMSQRGGPVAASGGKLFTLLYSGSQRLFMKSSRRAGWLCVAELWSCDSGVVLLSLLSSRFLFCIAAPGLRRRSRRRLDAHQTADVLSLPQRPCPHPRGGRPGSGPVRVDGIRRPEAPASCIGTHDRVGLQRAAERAGMKFRRGGHTAFRADNWSHE